MSVTQPNLTIVLSENTGCSGISLADTTDDYGLSGGPTVNDVTDVSIVLTYNTLESEVTYDFEVLNGEITAATLTIASGTPTDIFDNLTSTVWPFTESVPFDLTGDYGVSLPTFEDDVFTAEYTIEGEVSAEAFSFTTTRSKMIACNSSCCLKKKWVAVDLNCSCSTEALQSVMYGQSLYYQSQYAAEAGNLEVALGSLNSLKQICTQDCGC